MLVSVRTRGEEKLSFGNTAPYSFTTSRILWSSSGNANLFLSSSSSSSSSPSSSESSLSGNLNTTNTSSQLPATDATNPEKPTD